MRLTLLAPNIIEAFPNGRQASGLALAVLLRLFQVGWQAQAEALS